MISWPRSRRFSRHPYSLEFDRFPWRIAEVCSSYRVASGGNSPHMATPRSSKPSLSAIARSRCQSRLSGSRPLQSCHGVTARAVGCSGGYTAPQRRFSWLPLTVEKRGGASAFLAGGGGTSRDCSSAPTAPPASHAFQGRTAGGTGAVIGNCPIFGCTGALWGPPAPSPLCVSRKARF